MIRAQEQSAIYGIPNLTYRMPGGVGGGFNHHLIGTKANNRASLSYVTGAHNMKFGYQGGFNNPDQTYQYFNEVIHVRLNNGAPNRLTQVITTNDSPARIKVTRNLWPTSFYGQDQWTLPQTDAAGGRAVRQRLHVLSSTDSRRPGVSPDADSHCVSFTRDTRDRLARRHAASGGCVDLFGNGKTALKFNLGKYMEGFASQGGGSGMFVDLNPINRITTNTTRSWTDSNKDFVPNCELINPNKNGECGDMADKSFGKEVFTRSWDPDFVTGQGSRPYNSSWACPFSRRSCLASL